MKILLVFFLLPLSCLSQSYKKLNASISKIDSIAKADGDHFMADAALHPEKDGEIIATGNIAYSYYVSPDTKKELIKGIFTETLKYNENHSGYTEETLIELYYKNNELFYARFNHRKNKDGIDTEKYIHAYPVADGIMPSWTRPDIRQRIEETDRRILEYYKQ